MAIHRKHLKDNGVKILSAMENIPETPKVSCWKVCSKGLSVQMDTINLY